MRTAAAHSLKDLDDTQLLASLDDKTHHARTLIAELLAHLAEVDERRLYLTLGYPSLFQFCLSRLRFSEDEAGKRIQAARVARRHPEIFDLLARGHLTLTAVTLLAPHLDDSNRSLLLTAAEGKSKRELEELLAARFARPDAPTLLRRLPAPDPTRGDLALPLLPFAASSPNDGIALPARRDSTSPAPTLPTTEQSEQAVQTETPAVAAPSAERLIPQHHRPAPRAIVAPLSAERFKLQVTLSREGRDALLRAQALMRSTAAAGDLAVVLERALELLCEQLEARKFGKRRAKADRAATTEVAPASPASDAHEHAPEHTQRSATLAAPIASTLAAPIASTLAAPTASTPAQPAHAAPPTRPTCPRPKTAPSRYIPRDVRRTVAERDSYRCAYVAENGQRCSATALLEYHHRQPFARGGQTTRDGIELRCRGHNDLQARLDFGEAHMAAAKRPDSRSPRTSRQSTR